jgi:predicted dehydrogenase
VGAGRAGTHLHYGALRAAGAEIVGFVEGNADLLEQTTRRFGLKQGFRSLDEAFEKAGKLDFVDICSSTKSHYPLTRQAVEKGCHVLIEKPITENLEELEALKALRAGSDRAIGAVHNHKFYPGMEELRRRVAAGEAGSLLFVHREMSFFHDRVRMMEEGHWAHQIPGGRLFEANPHNLYLLHGLVGEMEFIDIHPHKAGPRWPHAAIDEFTASLRAGRTQVSIHMSLNAEPGFNAQRHGPNFILAVGARKILFADYSTVMDLGRFDISRPGTKGILERVRERTFAGKTLDAEGRLVNTGRGSGHLWMLDRFVGYIEGRYPEEPVPFEEAYFVQHMNLEMGMRVEELVRSPVGA